MLQEILSHLPDEDTAHYGEASKVTHADSVYQLKQRYKYKDEIREYNFSNSKDRSKLLWDVNHLPLSRLR